MNNREKLGGEKCAFREAPNLNVNDKAVGGRLKKNCILHIHVTLWRPQSMYELHACIEKRDITEVNMSF